MLLWHTSTANDNNPTGRQPNARAVERTAIREETKCKQWQQQQNRRQAKYLPPSVRQPMMKMLVKNKGGALVQAVKDSENIIRHCDSGTGFSCFNWTKHFKRAANLISLMRQEAEA